MAERNYIYKVNGKLYKTVQEMADFYEITHAQMCNYMKNKICPKGYCIRVLSIIDMEDHSTN